MSVKSRLLAAFTAVALMAGACATQQSAQTEATSSVEEIPNEEGGEAGASATGAQPTTAATPGVQLNRIEATEDGFVVKMPGQPQVQRNKVTIPAGDVTTAAWNTNVNGVIYSISTADYPEKVVAARPAEAFLEEGKSGLVNQLKGTLKSEEAITINGIYPGKAYTVASDAGEVRARNYLVGPRLYTMLVLYNPSIGAPGADEFLGSLELVNPPPVIERKSATPAATDGGSPADGGSATDAGTGPTDAGTPAPKKRAK
ncbi:hypothetical protein P2318_30585 [Myxococcaceae bacterium GXIMD 01537]